MIHWKMMKRTALVWVSLAAVILVAAFFRFYDLYHYPPGLFPDQAANGEDALLILTGDWRPFYERGNGREALFFYLQALLILLFGVGVWQMFAASVIVGVLTVAALYFAARPWFGRLAGLLAALFLATNHWHVTLSRTGFRAILIPFFIAAFMACVGYVILLVRRENTRWSYVFAAAAGIFFAGGFYTYIAYRVMVGVVLGVGLMWLLASLHPRVGWPHLVRYWRQLVIGIVAAVIVILPLAVYFVRTPEAVIGRAGQVSIFNQDLQRPGGVVPTLLWSAQETVSSFFVGEGDRNWRHSVAGYPLLNPLVGFLFLLGLVWCGQGLVRLVIAIVRGQELHLGLVFPYLFLLLLGMLLPVVTTAEGIPHGLRSIGLVVPIFIIAGAAGAVILHRLSRLVPAWRAVSLGVAGGLLFLSLSYDGLLYFLVARNTAAAAQAYRADLVVVATWLREYRSTSPQAARPYLVLDAFSAQTVHFLTHRIDRTGIVPPPHDFRSHPDEAQHLYRLADPGESPFAPAPGSIVVFTQSTLWDADQFAAAQGEELELVTSVRNRFYEEVMRVYRMRGEAPETPTGEEGNVPAGLDA